MFSPKEEARFVKRLAKREGKAWREFLELYRPLCYSLAKRYNCQANFDDFFAELIVELVTGGLEEAAGVPLAKVVSRRFSDIISLYMHHSRRRPHRLIYEDVSLEPAASFLAERDELYALLEEAQKELDPEERRLLSEYFDERLTLNAMAEKRNLHTTTVLRRLKKIYAKLASSMEGKGTLL
ncbi:sigma-70 family RNA polymerase sigma factor [bacterium]|nr:sigma-70 family RNA polymerase sigma factor [bacterium]